METGNFTRNLRVGPVGFLGLALCAVAGVGAYRSYEDPLIVQYRQEFVNNDGCLAGKVFDPSKGAHVSVGRLDGSKVVTVRSSDEKQILHLQEADEGLQFSDHITAGILARAGCELPDGS